MLKSQEHLFRSNDKPHTPTHIMTQPIKKLCVYCGSRPGNNPSYIEAARKTGQIMAEQGVALVYGAGSTGMMGAVANGVLDAGGEVIGVIPKGLNRHERAHPGLSEIHVVETMHERKALMEEISDGMVALPGGYGTLDEMFEVLTWSVLGIHQKPCGFLNVEGYWDPVLALMNHMLKEGFISQEYHELALMDSDFHSLLDKLNAYTPSNKALWLTT